MKFIATDNDIHQNGKIRALNRSFPGIGFAILHFLWSEIGKKIDIDNENPEWKDPEPVETLSEYFHQETETIEKILCKLNELNLINYTETIAIPKLIERETTQKYLRMLKGGRKGGKKKKNPPSTPLEAPSKNLNLNLNSNLNPKSKKEEELPLPPRKIKSDLSINAENSYSLNDEPPPPPKINIDQEKVDEYNDCWKVHPGYKLLREEANTYNVRLGYDVFCEKVASKDENRNWQSFIRCIKLCLEIICDDDDLVGRGFKGTFQTQTKLLQSSRNGYWLNRILSPEFNKNAKVKQKREIIN